MILGLILFLSNYGASYDGFSENKHYFQINTPKADYGIVLEDMNLYCDMIVEK